MQLLHDPQVVSYPPFPEVSLTLSDLMGKLFFFTADRVSQRMSGFQVITDPSKEVMVTEQVWTLQFPVESERIVSTVSKSQNGEVQMRGGEEGERREREGGRRGEERERRRKGGDRYR